MCLPLFAGGPGRSSLDAARARRMSPTQARLEQRGKPASSGPMALQPHEPLRHGRAVGAIEGPIIESWGVLWEAIFGQFRIAFQRRLSGVSATASPSDREHLRGDRLLPRGPDPRARVAMVMVPNLRHLATGRHASYDLARTSSRRERRSDGMDATSSSLMRLTANMSMRCAWSMGR